MDVLSELDIGMKILRCSYFFQWPLEVLQPFSRFFSWRDVTHGCNMLTCPDQNPHLSVCVVSNCNGCRTVPTHWALDVLHINTRHSCVPRPKRQTSCSCAIVPADSFKPWQTQTKGWLSQHEKHKSIKLHLTDWLTASPDVVSFFRNRPGRKKPPSCFCRWCWPLTYAYISLQMLHKHQQHFSLTFQVTVRSWSRSHSSTSQLHSTNSF